jgi:heme exporter protein D
MRLSFTPGRALNDRFGLFGLTLSDLLGAVCIFLICSTALEDTSYGILALPMGLLSLLCLVPIRLTTRRRILRDSALYYMRSKVLTARNHRVHSRT